MTTENTEARRLIAAILKTGATICVWEGGDWAIQKSTNPAAIFAALNSTGIDHVLARNQDGKRLGSFALIWGNAPDGSELIADYTDNDFCRALAQVETV